MLAANIRDLTRRYRTRAGEYRIMHTDFSVKTDKLLHDNISHIKDTVFEAADVTYHLNILLGRPLDITL